jgi:hypothetical protein
MSAIETPAGEERSSIPGSHRLAVETNLVEEATLANDSTDAWSPQATLARDIPRVMGMTQTVSPGQDSLHAVPQPAIIRIACRVANCNLRSP